jgi:hypothetical protein
VLLAVLHDEARYVEGLRLDPLIVLVQLDLEKSLVAYRAHLLRAHDLLVRFAPVLLLS